jgi:alkylation response protein AidB-like acyl-CoA dehydrogenase|tara:strand:+ start:7767 stop:8957 length:1191 start_codon:yes stop_codon:yes gene_type:complete
MDFSYNSSDIAFRDELRTWIDQNLPNGWGRTVHAPRDEDGNAMFRLDWEKKLFAGGWNGIAWPKKYGGRGATLVEQALFSEEMARAKAPEGLNIIGRNLVATTLLHYGSEKQRQRFLPKIIAGEEVWCQGFSEPNAGSDLAAVLTKAELKGDHFVVNGQKTWTSFAQYAQWCILLARTNTKAAKHKGLSFILVDMSTPGIEIRPLRQISGENEFNETFFDDVKVPVENLVGDLHGGWKIAMTTLAYERGPEDALGRQLVFRQELDKLIELAGNLPRGTGYAIDDPVVRQKIGQSLIAIEIMRLNCLRAFSKSLKGQPRASESSLNKLYWSHVMQDMFETSMEVAGPLAALTNDDPDALDGGRFQLGWLRSKAFTIYSGSSEIQRNIIAERMLGLPR